MRSWALALFIPLIALLVGAPASIGLAGGAWLVVVAAALWAALRLPAVRSPERPHARAARVWAGACALALAMQAAAIAYWGDPSADLHGEALVCVGAAATWVLVQRPGLSPMQQTWLTHSLALASWVAMGVTYLYGRETPANPITWAASASFLVCLLLPESLRPTAVWWHRVVWALSALAGIVAVLLSLSRGSYGLIPWVLALTVAVTGRDWRRRPAQAKRVRHAVTLVASAVVLLALLAAALPRVYREPLARLGQARSEATAMWVASSSPQAMNTSLGARLHLWHMSAQGLGELPLIGYGREGRISWIHELGARSGAVGVQSQDHLHNEILNSAYTYGLLGLLSYACLIAGLGWVVLRGRSEDPTPRRALSGVLWMHVTAGLSFVNLSDPYYASMLSLSVALAWMLAREPSATPPTPQPA